jgi:hypothetical protein
MGGPAFVAEQSPEEVPRLVCAAAVEHRPIVAQYDGVQRLLCPHVVGYNRPGEWRVFCYQFGGETKRGPRADGGEGIWRCLSLKKLSGVKFMDGPWRSEPHARQRCVKNIEVDAADDPGGDPQNGQ